MKTKAAAILSSLIAVVAALVIAQTFTQPVMAQQKVIPRISQSGSSSDQTMVALGSIESKLNKLLQSQGGRYAFLVSDGELIRLDTQTGKIAMFNIVQGASWDTLDIPENTVGPGNAFYEKYVQFLDKTEFNTN